VYLSTYPYWPIFLYSLDSVWMAILGLEVSHTTQDTSAFFGPVKNHMLLFFSHLRLAIHLEFVIDEINSTCKKTKLVHI